MGEKYRENPYSFWPRFGSALLGSVIFHVSILIIGSLKYDDIITAIVDTFPDYWMLYFAYSAMFAFIAASYRRGSLVRHFSTGVALPASTYWVSSVIILIMSISSE